MDTSTIVRVISGALFLIVASVLVVRRNKKSI
ncbi:MAG TPA: LPXTG cell wall anchor domain-containing protein [Acidobacteriaceae bacterium]|nr:LPXTG cell wall anchor domain-containing protein [Acidobacteriaceae bacterium]